MIITIRGTSGSGKSTLARRIMQHYPYGEPAWIDRRRNPLYYELRRVESAGNVQIGRTLRVLGHYATPAGGGDTLDGLDQISGLVQDAHDWGHDVLYEGLVVSSDFIRVEAMHRSGLPVAVIGLATTLEECLDSIRARRKAAGNNAELNPKATQDKYRAVELMMTRFQKAGVPTFVLDRDAAYLKCCELLGLDPDASPAVSLL